MKSCAMLNPVCRYFGESTMSRKPSVEKGAEGVRFATKEGEVSTSEYSTIDHLRLQLRLALTTFISSRMTLPTKIPSGSPVVVGLASPRRQARICNLEMNAPYDTYASFMQVHLTSPVPHPSPCDTRYNAPSQGYCIIDSSFSSLALRPHLLIS